MTINNNVKTQFFPGGVIQSCRQDGNVTLGRETFREFMDLMLRFMLKTDFRIVDFCESPTKSEHIHQLSLFIEHYDPRLEEEEAQELSRQGYGIEASSPSYSIDRK
jgi:hypothetical protein